MRPQIFRQLGAAARSLDCQGATTSAFMVSPRRGQIKKAAVRGASPTILALQNHWAFGRATRVYSSPASCSATGCARSSQSSPHGRTREPRPWGTRSQRPATHARNCPQSRPASPQSRSVRQASPRGSGSSRSRGQPAAKHRASRATAALLEIPRRPAAGPRRIIAAERSTFVADQMMR